MSYFLTRALRRLHSTSKRTGSTRSQRRRFMTATLAAGAAAVPGTMALASPAALPAFPGGRIRSEFVNYKDPMEHQRQSFRILRNMRENADVLFWYHFQMYAVQDGRRPEAVVRWEGIELSHHQKLGKGMYRIGGHNLSFPRDIKTGRWTDSAVNPITGETVAVPAITLTGDPGYLYTPDGVIPLDSPEAPPRIRHEQFLIEGDLMKIEQVRQPPASWPATFIETSANWSPLSLFQDDSILDLPTGTSGGYVFPWPEWMDMGDRPGHMFATWNGRKLQSVDQLPAEFFQKASTVHPELLEVDMTRFSKALPEPLAKRVAEAAA